MLYPVSEVRNFVTALDHPEGVAAGRDGTLYAGGETGQVYSISADGTEVKTLGNTGGFCLGITLDREENIYICDCGKRSLLKMTQAGGITVVADSIGGRRFANPNFSVFDGVVYRLSAGGSLKVFAPGPFHFANGLALDAAERHLYIVESNLDRVVRVEIKADGASGLPEVYAEGLARVPDGLAFDAAGNLYVITYASNCIYRVSTDRSVRLLCQDLENLLLWQPINCAFGGPGFDQPYIANLGRRDFVTRLGVLRLKIARTRQKSFLPGMLKGFQRRAEEVMMLIREAFLRGISTRQVGRVVAVITGEAVSAQTVSKLTRGLDRLVKAFHQARLQDEWAYLFLDGVSLRVRRPAGRKRVQMLVAYGVRRDGSRQLLAFLRSQGESQSAWEGLLQDLYRRGLEGQNLQLIITDGCPGLAAAIQTVYPRVEHQRCWAHKMRNIGEQVRKRDREAVKAEAQAIYQAESQAEAQAAFRTFRQHWQEAYPAMVRRLEQDLPELLAFLRFPRHLWKKLRTTNAIERQFVEVRRRTRPMVCFVNVASVDRIIFAIFNRFNEEWKNRTLRLFTQAA